VERALPVFDRLPRGDRREVLIHLGMIHAFTMDFRRALAAMEASSAYADSPLARAESRFFAGLLLTKRLNLTADGRAAIHEALAHIEHLTTPEACCERAWLYNLMALSYVGEKNLAAARESCRKVLDSLKGAPHTPDATHIKINVISNITVLDEYGKDLRGAIARWAFFEPMLASAGPVFGKHYLFRKGGLLAKAKRWKEAAAALETCYALAEETRDVFYGDVIARGIAAIHYQQASFAKAARWYEQSLAAKSQLIEDDDRGRVTFALALCFAKAGATVNASRLLDELERDEAARRDDRLAQGIRELRDRGREGITAAVETWATALPESKLNRPFDFTNFY
jgi:hypothetical protein